jgi:nucleoside phosphorylase
METATLFTVGFHNRIPIGALLQIEEYGSLIISLKII